jgi:hypothetical protein
MSTAAVMVYTVRLKNHTIPHCSNSYLQILSEKKSYSFLAEQTQPFLKMNLLGLIIVHI